MARRAAASRAGAPEPGGGLETGRGLDRPWDVRRAAGDDDGDLALQVHAGEVVVAAFRQVETVADEDQRGAKPFRPWAAACADQHVLPDRERFSGRTAGQ